MEELLQVPRWTRRLTQMAPGSPGAAGHRHRLTTIKTKSAAVGWHEYWMGGGGRGQGHCSLRHSQHHT